MRSNEKSFALRGVMAREFKGARHCLGDELAAKLKALCESRGMTASKVIRIAVQDFLDRQDPKPKAKPKGGRRPASRGS